MLLLKVTVEASWSPSQTEKWSRKQTNTQQCLGGSARMQAKNYFIFILSWQLKTREKQVISNIIDNTNN